MEKEARKKDILETAMHMFAEKGFHAVKVDDIAESVGLSKGTIYLYFKNKENLFFSIIEEKTKEMFARMREALQSQESIDRRLERFVTAFLKFFDMNKPYFKLIHTEKTRMHEDDRYRLRNHMLRVFSDYESLLVNFVREGQQEGFFRSMEPQMIAKSLRGLLNSFAFQRIFVDSQAPLTDETAYVVDLFLNGARQSPEKE